MPPKAKAKQGPKSRDPVPVVRASTRSRGTSPPVRSGGVVEDLATRLKTAFRSLDTGRTGTISRHEMKSVLMQLDENLTNAKVEDLLRAVDKSGTHDQIDYRDFINYIVRHEQEVKDPPTEPELTTGHVVKVFSTVERMARRDELDILDATDVEQITADELLEIQKLHRPPAVVQRILECTCMIIEARRSAKPRPPPDWTRLRAVIADDSFIPAVLEFDVRYLARAPALTRFLHERFFGQDALTYERVLYANVAAAALFKWCSAIVMKAKKEQELPTEPVPIEEEAPPEQEPPAEPVPIEEEPIPEQEPKLPTPIPTPPPSPPPSPPRTPPAEPEPDVEELPPEPIPTPEPEPEDPLPLTEVELSHLSFRRDAGVCPDGWWQDSDCVVCFIWAHLEFRRDAEVCPDGYLEDRQCTTCCMFSGLKRFMFGGDMPAVPGLPVGPRHTEIVAAGPV